MSVDTTKWITTERLSHYHSRLNSNIIQPMIDQVDNIASNLDIDEVVFEMPRTSIVVTNATLDAFVANVKNGTYDSDFISRADVSGVTNMGSMFFMCTSIVSLDLSGWDVSNVTDTSNEFNACASLTSLDLSGWNVSSVTDMHNMFRTCSSLTSLDLSDWDVSSVTYMYDMFNGCSSLTSLDLSSWDVSGVTNMNGMFADCGNITSLLIGGSINTNLDLSTTKLTSQAANAFFNGLSAKTANKTVTITMPSTAQGADISIATSKGYTVTGIN